MPNSLDSGTIEAGFRNGAGSAALTSLFFSNVPRMLVYELSFASSSRALMPGYRCALQLQLAGWESECEIRVYIKAARLQLSNKRKLPCPSHVKRDVDDACYIRRDLKSLLDERANTLPAQSAHEVAKL